MITYDFVDNAAYGAEDVNAIRQSMFRKGVVAETANSCLVFQYEDGSYGVMEGQAFFADGSRIVVDALGVKLTPEAGTLHYVYFYNNSTQNKRDICCTAEEPTGDYVLLATVEADGTVTDKREFTAFKISTIVTNQYEVIDREIQLEKNLNDWEKVDTIPLNSHAYRYLMAEVTVPNAGTTRIFLDYYTKTQSGNQYDPWNSIAFFRDNGRLFRLKFEYETDGIGVYTKDCLGSITIGATIRMS